MKKTLYISTLGILLSFSSCSDFLDTTPTDFISPKNYYGTESEINAALAGVYDILGRSETYSDYITVNYAVATDESYYARSAQSIGTEVNNYSSSDAKLTAYWKALYEGINRANELLVNIDKADMDSRKKDAAKGEALFLRGFYYFHLVQNWGAVPVRLEPLVSVNDVNIAKTPANEVYAQILKDMEAAESLVYGANEVSYGGRITKSAVQGILARVNLYMAGEPLKDASRYPEALKWAKKVKDSGIHALNPSYSQVFINLAQEKYDLKESIWEAEFNGNRTNPANAESGRVGNTFGISCLDVNIGYCYAFVNTTARLYNLYEGTDIRRDWAIAPYRFVTTGANTAPVNWTSTQIYDRNTGKWRREYETTLPKDKNGTPINFQILRYSDVLLMLAEAENEVNGPTAIAHQALNEVRSRAKATLYTGDNQLGSREEFRKAIQDERSRELCFEGLRRYDLIRWGIYLPVMKEVAAEINATAPAAFKYAARAGDNAAERNLLFPIPQSELSLNSSLEQNPGW